MQVTLLSEARLVPRLIVRVENFFVIGATGLDELQSFFFILNHKSHVEHAALPLDLKRLTHVRVSTYCRNACRFTGRRRFSGSGERKRRQQNDETCRNPESESFEAPHTGRFVISDTSLKENCKSASSFPFRAALSGEAKRSNRGSICQLY